MVGFEGTYAFHSQHPGKKQHLCVEFFIDFHSQSGPQQNFIELKNILQVARNDSKSYCMTVSTKSKRFYLAFKSDEELYGWQQEIRARSPEVAGQPTDFQHKVHVHFDSKSGEFLVSFFFVEDMWLTVSGASGSSTILGQVTYQVQNYEERLRARP